MQILGELSATGSTTIECMGGTVLFGINENIANNNNFYKYQPLTVFDKKIKMFNILNQK